MSEEVNKFEDFTNKKWEFEDGIVNPSEMMDMSYIKLKEILKKSGRKLYMITKDSMDIKEVGINQLSLSTFKDYRFLEKHHFVLLTEQAYNTLIGLKDLYEQKIKLYKEQFIGIAQLVTAGKEIPRNLL